MDAQSRMEAIEQQRSARNAALVNSLDANTAASDALRSTMQKEKPAEMIPLQMPERFSGDRAKTEAFLAILDVHFMVKPALRSSQAKAAFLASNLGGEALIWIAPLLSGDSPMLQNWPQLRATFERAFGNNRVTIDAPQQLLKLQQGSKNLASFVSDFQRLRNHVKWDDKALADVFFNGLNSKLRQALALRPRPEKLDLLIEYVMELEARIGAAAGIIEDSSSPMEVDAATTFQSRNDSDPEMQRRRRQGLCFHCGRTGHVSRFCRERQRAQGQKRGQRAVASVEVEQDSSSTILSMMEKISKRLDALEIVNKNVNSSAYIVALNFSKGNGDPRPFAAVKLQGVCAGRALLDTGAAENFVSYSVVQRLGLKLVDLRAPVTVQSIEGRVIERVCHSLKGIKVELASCTGVHDFLVSKNINADVILGAPWFKMQKPKLDWSEMRVVGSVGVPAVEEWDKIQAKFVEVFKELDDSSPLPPHRPFDCTIPLVSSVVPPPGRTYPMNVEELKELQAYLEKSQAMGRIFSCDAPTAAPVMFVNKKDGGRRLCVDYRHINAVTEARCYPLPLVDELLDRAANAKYFTTLDLRDAYHLLRVAPGEEWKTAFRCRYGVYAYRVMPFGLRNAPAHFQAYVNYALAGLLDDFCTAYLDDILIFSEDKEAHLRHVNAVFERLEKHGLRVKASKCDFMKPEVKYLGYVLGRGTLGMDPTKIQAVLDWPRPAGLRQLQGFLGFVNFYRRFIHCFAEIASPLHGLSRKGVKFVWGEAQETSFQCLREALTRAPVLMQPDLNSTFYLETDASDVALGCVLSQKRDGVMHPCAYLSRALTSAERNYPILEREALAIKEGLEKWRHYLQGSSKPTVVQTDHKNLLALQSIRCVSGRLARWALFFSSFRISVQHVAGLKNGRADALSRAGCAEPTSERMAGPLIKFVPLQAAETNVVQENTKLIEQAHSSRLGGHGGIKPTLYRLKQCGHSWRNMYQDVRKFVLNCQQCQLCKSGGAAKGGLLQAHDTPPYPWHTIAMDFVTGLPEINGMSCIMTVVDRFSKYAHFVPLPGLPSAIETAAALFSNVFKVHGIPKKIISDRGSQFTAKVTRWLCDKLGVKQNISSAFHPQTDGQSEKTNHTVETYMRCFVGSSQGEWVELLSFAEF